MPKRFRPAKPKTRSGYSSSTSSDRSVFKRSARLDPSQVEDRRGRRPTKRVRKGSK